MSSLRDELERLRAENAALKASVGAGAAAAAGGASGGRGGGGGGGGGGGMRTPSAGLQPHRAGALAGGASPSPRLGPSAAAGEAASEDPVYGEWGPAPRRALGRMRLWVGSWNMVRARAPHSLARSLARVHSRACCAD